MTARDLTLNQATALANFSYNPNPNGVPAGYTMISLPVDMSFLADILNVQVLQQTGTNNYVFSFRGTASGADIAVDAVIAKGDLPDRAIQSKEFVAAFINEHSNSNFTLVGHSLGGFMAEYVGAALTYSPPANLGVGTISALGINAPTIPSGSWSIEQASVGALNNVISLNTTADTVSALMRWSRLSEQKIRVDKWRLCRVRLPCGAAAG